MNGPWRLEFRTYGGWRSIGDPEDRFELASESLRLFAKFSRADWRIVDNRGVRILEIQPGARGDA